MAMWWQIGLYVLISVGAVWLGYGLARSRVMGSLLMGAVVALLLIHGVWLADHLRWGNLLPWREVWLWSNPTGWGAGMLVGAAWRLLPDVKWQKALLCAAMAGLGVDRSIGWMYRERAVLGRERWEGNVCRQTTKSSCGPAAVASALRALGITTSEKDMAEAGMTRAAGTSNLGIYRALRAGLDGTSYRIRAYVGEPEGLTAFPAVVSIESQGVAVGLIPVGAKHAVAVLGRDEQGRWIVADPYAGMQRWNPEWLQSVWTGGAWVIQNEKN